MMHRVRRQESGQIVIGPRVIIETGPMRVTALATPELLHNDNTAGHYRVGERDALGKEIVLGEEMTYLTHGADAVDPVIGWHVHEKVDQPEGSRVAFRWEDRGAYATEDEAIAAAHAVYEGEKTDG